MSKNPKSQIIYLLRILEHCGKIQLYLKNINDSILFFNKEDQLYFNACLNLLVQIGEQSNKIDDSVKNAAANIPWVVLKGFRNIAVHEYQFVDAEKVYAICSQHISLLQNDLEDFIRNAVQKNLISGFELSLSKDSEFYKHVRFNKLTDS